MTATLKPYTGAYQDYGYQPEWNWFDFLNKYTQATAGATPGTPPTSNQNNQYINQNDQYADSDMMSRSNAGANQSDSDSGYGGYSPGNPTGQNSGIPEGGITNGISAGQIAGAIASMGGLPGVATNAIGMGVDAIAGEDPMNTDMANIGGVGSLATSPGPVGALAGNFNGIAGIMGKLNAQKLAEIASAAALGEDGNAVGTLDHQIVGVSPGPFGIGTTFSGVMPEALRGQTRQRIALRDKMLAEQEKNRVTNARAKVEKAIEGNGNMGGGGRGGGHQGGLGDGQRGAGDRDRGGNPSAGHAGFRRKGGMIQNRAEGGMIQNMAFGGLSDGPPKDKKLQQQQYRNRPEFQTPFHGWNGMNYAEGGEVVDGEYEDLTDYGRGNDTEMAHVTPGELMIPPEFQQEYPALMHKLYHAMMKEGMDPTQFTAGMDDSKNPDTGLPEYGFWKKVKKIGKKVLPVGIGAGTAYLTGSDILGGLAAGGSSKLMGNDWGTAALTGIGTGLMSHMTGLSGEGEGLLGGFLNGNLSMDGLGAATSGVGSGAGGAAAGLEEGGGSFLDGIGDKLSSAGNWLADNPMATAAGLSALASATQKTPKYEDPGTLQDPNSDPAYTDQINNGGWGLDREFTAPNVDWYVYGEMPQSSFWDKVNANATPMKAGGKVPNDWRGAGVMRSAHLARNGGQADGAGGGQDDLVPVNLSTDEYVIPADVVASLGDGSSKHGGKKMDKFVANVRKHKAVRGHPPMAKSLEAYL